MRWALEEATTAEAKLLAARRESAQAGADAEAWRLRAESSRAAVDAALALATEAAKKQARAGGGQRAAAERRSSVLVALVMLVWSQHGAPNTSSTQVKKRGRPFLQMVSRGLGRHI